MTTTYFAAGTLFGMTVQYVMPVKDGLVSLLVIGCFAMMLALALDKWFVRKLPP